jgi:hypothetical protein
MSTEDLTTLSRKELERRITVVEEELEDIAIERSLGGRRLAALTRAPSTVLPCASA